MTYWHGPREVVIINKQMYMRNGSYETMLTLDMGESTVFHMWEEEFFKFVTINVK